jgi:hypothetical protein
MSDRLMLSCHVRGFHPLRMAGDWEKMLGLFPFSRLAKSPVYFRVHAIGFSEPVLLERAWEPPFEPARAVEAAREAIHDDCAWQLECAWDLLQKTGGEWKLTPAPVSLWCFGPQFDNELGDHLRIEFGLEDPFLPQPGDPLHTRAAQANLQSLMKLVKDIEHAFPLELRHLWSESGENFAERIARLYAGSASGTQ